MAESKDSQEPTIIRNGSQAYGYKYSSLADIANAGVKIPKMRVKRIGDDDYVEYLDDNGEWQLGAKVVVPDMKSSNAAQRYGSALTYARRYTVQLAKSLACDDDAKIEKQPPTPNKNQPKKTPSSNDSVRIDWAKVREIKEKMASIENVEELRTYWSKLNLNFAYQRLLMRHFQERAKELAPPEDPDYVE